MPRGPEKTLKDGLNFPREVKGKEGHWGDPGRWKGVFQDGLVAKEMGERLGHMEGFPGSTKLLGELESRCLYVTFFSNSY